MANTFKKIQTVTVGSGGAASIDFTSIPQTYTDLKIVLSARTNRANATDEANLTFNNNTSSSYSWRMVYGDGTSVASPSGSSTTSIAGIQIPGGNATANIFGNVEIYIPNYTSANNKSASIDAVPEDNATTSYMKLTAGLLANTTAITSVKISGSSGSLVQYSTATLYGISDVTAASNAYATGGIITYDDTYVYHTFPWSGTFTPTRSLNVDYLVVAGGGGGSIGGGGAGGLRCTVGATGGGGSLESQLAVTAQAYTVTVGAGGAGQFTAGSGSNSVFGSITSTGGGAGRANTSGVEGGSGGGGGAAQNDPATNGGAGTANQGYAGGGSAAAVTQANSNGGGGGGANAAGTAGTTGTGGNGGNGVATSISGTSTTYAGGGGGGGNSVGGGTGGSGGGGAGSKLTTATAGTANTGGGGGGSGWNGSLYSASGGSGIVIVRYAR